MRIVSRNANLRGAFPLNFLYLLSKQVFGFALTHRLISTERGTEFTVSGGITLALNEAV